MGRSRTIGKIKKQAEKSTEKRKVETNFAYSFLLNQNISRFKGWQDWQEKSNIFQIEAIDGKYKGITLDVFNHYKDKRYYCISDSLSHQGAAIEIIKIKYCKVI